MTETQVFMTMHNRIIKRDCSNHELQSFRPLVSGADKPLHLTRFPFASRRISLQMELEEQQAILGLLLTKFP
jgi:hypothetical protein